MKKLSITAIIVIIAVYAIAGLPPKTVETGGSGTYQIQMNESNIARLDTRTGEIDVFLIKSQPKVDRNKRILERY